MFVTFKAKAAGPLFNASAGETLELDDDVAQPLVARGACVEVKAKAVAKPVVAPKLVAKKPQKKRAAKKG